MVFAVVPADDLIVLLDEREETVLPAVESAPFLHLRQDPRTRDDGVGLEKLDGGGRRHLAGDDAREVSFYRQLVDGHDLIGLDDDAQRALEHLGLLTFPVEVDADGDIVEREGGVRCLRREGEFAILCASPHNASLEERDGLRTRDHLTLGNVGLLEFEVYLLGRDDTHGYGRLLLHGALKTGRRTLLVVLQTVDHLLELFLRQRYLVENGKGLLWGETLEVLLARSDDHPCHVECAWRDDELVVALGVVAVWAMLGPGEYHRQIFVDA